MWGWTRRGLAAAMVALAVAVPSVGFASDGPVVVYIVRHAEKAGEKGGVALTDEGQARAEKLAGMLKDVPLTGVHSTDTLRTRSTAQPAATGHGLEVQLYDPRAPSKLVMALQTQKGHHLVVGHSNTIDVMVEVLGGDPGVTIRDDEYDRLYIVIMNEEAHVSTSLLRF